VEAVGDYEVETSKGPHRAVLMIAADRDLTKRIARPANRRLAERARPRSPTKITVGFDERSGALVQWLPADLWLPALAEPPAELARVMAAR
jgi:hypothetical protein